MFAAAKAMEKIGITRETPDPVGGHIVKDSEGNPIGVFEETAMTAFWDAYNEYEESLPKAERKAQWIDMINEAQKECIQKGITSFQDAGSKFFELDWYHEMAKKGELDLRLWAMVRHSYDDMKDNLSEYPIIDAGNKYFTSRAIKTEVDGALGAYGAWLLEPYDDKPGFVGQNTTSVDEVKRIASLAVEKDMQLCVHAIGDKANQVVLDICEDYISKNPKVKEDRWRIEHAQHLHPDDIPRFKQLGVIASMQAIHCTSDSPFVIKRLGEERARSGAYVWKSLLEAGAAIANGTDTPVEDVDPIQCFYATVTRKRIGETEPFFPEEVLTREQALYSYTLWNAYAAFEEHDKGSLEVGKLGDVTILSNDLLTCSEKDILNTKVLYTIIGGKVKYKKP